jgi:hypothetical protein
MQDTQNAHGKKYCITAGTSRKGTGKERGQANEGRPGYRLGTITLGV